MFGIIIQGILIGLFISVPVGPIGMLTIQRTLNRGRSSGIATGLGATTSDLAYTFITLFFLRFVLGFIEEHKILIQIFGSIILIAFGLFTYRSHPAMHKPDEQTSHSIVSDYFSAFGLTLSNPLILFILIGLFAQFGFVDSQSTFSDILVGILSVLVGATLWWATLTFIVSRFRRKLSHGGLRIINRISGSIIIVIGLVSFIA
ncbi:MAG: LysE family translocator, partial [Paludibacter sp.]|nr:LysE family translocator [Paludibacter sp.]